MKLQCGLAYSTMSPVLKVYFEGRLQLHCKFTSYLNLIIYYEVDRVLSRGKIVYIKNEIVTREVPVVI